MFLKSRRVFRRQLKAGRERLTKGKMSKQITENQSKSLKIKNKVSGDVFKVF